MSAAYNFSARVLAPYSAHPPAKSWAMVLEATVPPNLDRYRIGDAVSELPGVEDVVSRIRLGRVAALEQQVFAGGRGALSMVFGAVFANPNATKPGADPPRGQVAVLASHAGESQRVQPELTRRPPGIAPDPAGKRLVGMVGCNLSPSLLTGQWVRDLASTASDLFAIVQDVTSLSPHPCAEVSATVDQDFHGPASGAIAGELFRTCANGTRVSSLGHSDDVVPFVTGDTEAIVQQTEMEAVSCDEPEHVLMATLGGDDGSAEPLVAASGSAAEAAALATAGLRRRCETVRDRFAAVASSGLRAQFRTHLAGRTWLVSMAASQAVQDTTGPAVVAPTILAACLAALCAVVLCLLATAAVSASRQRLLAAELHRAEAAQLARAVHYTTVSFLAHEARGALAVTSTTVEALAEGLSRFGIRLPSGHTLRPGQLLGSSFPSMPAVSSFGAHSEASVLVRGLAEEGRWQPRAEGGDRTRVADQPRAGGGDRAGLTDESPVQHRFREVRQQSDVGCPRSGSPGLRTTPDGVQRAVASVRRGRSVLDARELAGGGAVSGHADLVSTGPLSRRARGDSASLGSPVAGSAAAGIPRTVSAQASPSFGSGLRLAGSRAGGLSTARPGSVSASSHGPSASVAESSGASQDDDQALSVAELLHDLEVVQAAAAACLRVVGDAADVIGVDPQLAHFGYIVAPLRQLTSETVLRARSMASVPIALRWASGTHPVALLDPAKAEVVIANSMIFVLKQAYSEELVVTMSDGLSPLPEAWFQEQPPELGIVAATTAGMPQRGAGGAASPSGSAGCCGASGGGPGRDAGREWDRLRGMSVPSVRWTVSTRPSGSAASSGDEPGTLDVVSGGSAMLVASPVGSAGRGGGLHGQSPDSILRPFGGRAGSEGVQLHPAGIGLPLAAHVASTLGGDLSLTEGGDGRVIVSFTMPLVPPPRLVAALRGFAGEVGRRLFAAMERANDASTLAAAVLAELDRAYQETLDARKAAEAASQRQLVDVPIVVGPGTVSGTRAADEPGPGPPAGAGQRQDMTRFPALRERDATGGERAGLEEGSNELLRVVGGPVGDAGTGSEASSAVPGGDDCKLALSTVEVVPSAPWAVAPARATMRSGPGALNGGRDGSVDGRVGLATGLALSSSNGPGRLSVSGPATSVKLASAPRAVSGRASAEATSEPPRTANASTGARARSTSPAPQRHDGKRPARAGVERRRRARQKGPLSGKRVLLVDDDLLVLRVTTRLLQRLGATVTAESDPLSVVPLLEATGQLTAAAAERFFATTLSPSYSGHSDGLAGIAGLAGQSGLPAGWERVKGESAWMAAPGMRCPHGSTAACAAQRKARAEGHAPIARSSTVDATGEFDLMFFDVIMPRLRGDVLAARLVHFGCTIPTIALTSNVAPADIHQYARSGFSAVVGKPASRAALLQVLKRLSDQ